MATTRSHCEQKQASPKLVVWLLLSFTNMLGRSSLTSLNDVGSIVQALQQVLSFELPVIDRLQEG